MEDEAEIPKFYANKTILLTGSTGFIGKVLIWKLLHSCPLIDKIYILIRPKKGEDIVSRLTRLFDQPYYDDLRKTNPSVFGKVVPILSDMGKPDLGLSAENRRLLIDNVSLVFHNAALLKMDASLKQAINVNTKGVIRMLDIAKEMKKLITFVYVSTAYSCCNEAEVEEKLYFFKENPRDIIHSVDWLPEHLLDKITDDLIAPLPNTYTYSKRLTELLLSEYESKLPIIIARPTIVVASNKEPIPGYMDNLNGAGGVAVTTGKGLLHSMPAHADKKGDLVPCDVICNSLIAIPWGEVRKNNTFERISVYNLALTEHEPITWRDFQIICEKAALKYPYEVMLWYPSYDVIQENIFLHNLSVIFFHWIPAYMVDFILLLLGRKRFLVQVQTKINQGLNVLRYFCTKQWTFRTDNILNLKAMMSRRDLEIFPVTEKGVDLLELSCNAAIVTKTYLFKESLDRLPVCRRRLKILYAIKIAVKVIFYLLLINLLLKLFSFL